MKIDIREIWKRQAAIADKQVLIERVSSIQGLRCYIGLVRYTGAKLFQLEVEANISIDKSYLHRFKGIEIQIVPNEKENLNKFTIILLEEDLLDIFCLFIEDIINELKPVFDTDEALMIINQRIRYWKELFANISGERLSLTQQRGLFGELFFLNLLLEKAINKEAILKSWIGPQRANQDFAIEKNAVEIKTTIIGSTAVNIANEHQLDFTLWDFLFLCFIEVNEVSDKQNTLFNMVNSIKDILATDNGLIQTFEMKLAQAGIKGDMIEDYNNTGYTISNYRFYHVRQDFPVITRRNLDYKAISNVKYKIDISQCDKFEEIEETVLKILL